MLYYSAVIFDLDGVMWNSSSIHAKAYSQTLKEIGVKVSKNIYSGIAGLKTEDGIKVLLNRIEKRSFNLTITEWFIAKGFWLGNVVLR